jgi:hypothetical protein
MPDAKNEFDVAKNVSDLLGGLKKEQQQRVLRWVAESLDLDELKTADHHLRHEAPSIGRTNPAAAGSDPKPSRPEHGPATDIKSFVASKNPKSDVQYAAVVAYFYRFEAPEAHRKDTITSEILQESTRLTGRKRLDKPSTTINNAKNLGYLDSPSRGEFRINTVGENLVAMTLPGQEGRSSPAPARAGRKAKK